jgi:hypothetical protein
MCFFISAEEAYLEQNVPFPLENPDLLAIFL